MSGTLNLTLDDNPATHDAKIGLVYTRNVEATTLVIGEPLTLCTALVDDLMFELGNVDLTAVAEGEGEATVTVTKKGLRFEYTAGLYLFDQEVKPAAYEDALVEYLAGVADRNVTVIGSIAVPEGHWLNPAEVAE